MLKGFVSGEEKDIKRIPMKGKNLWAITPNAQIGYNQDVGTDVLDSAGPLQVSASNGGMILTSNSSWEGTSWKIQVEVDKEYYISFDSVSQNLRITIYMADGNNKVTRRIANYTTNFPQNKELIILDNEKYIVISISLNIIATAEIIGPIISTDIIPYEPYGYQEGWEVRDNQDRLIWGREDELQTATGTLPFKGYGLPVKVKSLLGNAVQNGTPAPDNIVIPEMCGVRTGNLVEVSNSNCIIYSTYNQFTIENDTISIAGNALFGFIVKCSPSTQYTVSSTRTGYNCDMRIREYSEKPSDWTTDFVTQSVNVGSATRSASFTTNSETKYVLVCFYSDNVSKISNIMLNLGSTALAYEPYGYKIPLTNAGQTVPIYLGEVPTVRRVKKLVLDGTETFTILSANLFQITINGYLRENDIVIGVCSHFKNGTSTAVAPSSGTDEIRFLVSSSGNNFVYFAPSNAATLTDWTTFLADEYAAGHPVTIWYVLSNDQTGISNEPLCKISTYVDELTTIQVHGLSAPLYGIGDYKDTLNLSTGVVTRKVEKWVLTGDEGGWSKSTKYAGNFYNTNTLSVASTEALCTHLQNVDVSDFAQGTFTITELSKAPNFWMPQFDANTSLDTWKQYLRDQYTAGTPVTVWYVLSTPTTETVTVPTSMTGEIEGYLTQVSTPSPTKRSVPKWNGVEETGGTYAVTVYTPPEIPTTTGQNTLTVDTTLAPYEVTVEGHMM